MFADLLSRFAPAPARPTHDHLFTPFAPNGASPQLLSTLFHRYAGAPPDEPPPPQHKHYRAFVLELIHLYGGHSPPKARLNAAYVACFERDDAFQTQLKTWRRESGFCARLIEVRRHVIADLTEQAQSEAARRAHFSRWRECVATPIALQGDSLLDQIALMTPDDWHDIALSWDWRAGVIELQWIAAQRACDRATALYVLCSGWPGDIAAGKARPHAAFIRQLAARLEGGYYAEAAFSLALSFRQRLAFQQQLDAARATGQSPWQIDRALLDHAGARLHAPTYAVTNGRAHYHYEYWLAHVARPLH